MFRVTVCYKEAGRVINYNHDTWEGMDRCYNRFVHDSKVQHVEVWVCIRKSKKEDISP